MHPISKVVLGQELAAITGVSIASGGGFSESLLVAIRPNLRSKPNFPTLSPHAIAPSFFIAKALPLLGNPVAIPPGVVHRSTAARSAKLGKPDTLAPIRSGAFVEHQTRDQRSGRFEQSDHRGQHRGFLRVRCS